MHGLGDLPAGKDGAFKSGEVGGDDAQGADQFGEMDVADGLFETPLDLFAPEKPLAREDERIDELEQAPAVLHFTGETLHGDAIIPISPNGPNVGSHAATGDDVEFDAVFL